jgi:hypothetical protein
MRSLLGAFGLVCGAIVVWTVGNYGYGSSDDPAVKWNMAFLFGAIACGGLFGHAVAARLWQVHRDISITIGLVCGAALVVNLSNSLGALAGRADKSTIERIAQNKRVKSDEAELARLQRQREAIPTFAPTDEAAVAAAKRAADTASDNRRRECGNGDLKQRGPNCRQREIDEKAAADKLSTATTAKAATERAARLETAMTAIRQRLAAEGPVVTVNVQGSALARLFRLPDAEADFAVTVQQFGMAAIVELLIAFALIAWEMLRPTGATKLTASAVPREPDERSVEPVSRLAFNARPRPKLVSSGPPAGGVSDFVVERLETGKGSEIDFGEVYEDYMAWCRKRGAVPLDSEVFADAMKRICERARVRIEARGGTAVFVGLRFTAPATVALA